MNYKRMFFILLAALMVLPTSLSLAQPSGLPVDVPRNEVFVVDQILRYAQPGNHNFWVTGGENPVHRQALMMDQLWYRDQQTGDRLMGAAVSDPEYNADFTQMTVHLRDNIYWSDGVQFTADDLVYTVQTLMGNDKLGAGGWSAQLNQFVDSVDKVDDFTVQFNLKTSNPRFHTLFQARYNSIFMMPKHIFEKVDDLTTYTYSDNPVVLGAYEPVDFDPNGYWELFQRRDDWQRTSVGIVTGNPGPKYILTIFYDNSTKKVIAMSRGELDVFFDVDFEAFQSLLDTTPTARSWYTDFPWAYPNENSTRMITFNYDSDPIYQNKDVRWALALALNIVQLQTDYIGGVAKVSPIPVPPTPPLAKLFHDPMEQWFQDLQIELDNGEMYNPYDATVPDQIASWATDQGYTVPGTPREVFGNGWWKYAPDIAERLLVKNGFSRGDDGKWLKPDGNPWTMDLQAAPDEPDAFRIANAATDMWDAFGIDVNLQGLERSVWQNNLYTGQYQVNVPWANFTLIDGDAWPQVQGIDPKYYVPVGEDSRSKGGTGYINAMRLQDPKIHDFIDQMAQTAPGSDQAIQVTTDFLKYWTENMYFITTISFKKFITWDEKYWTGFPTSENPNYEPLYWFSGGRYAYSNLVSTQQ